MQKVKSCSFHRNRFIEILNNIDSIRKLSEDKKTQRIQQIVDNISTMASGAPSGILDTIEDIEEPLWNIECPLDNLEEEHNISNAFGKIESLLNNTQKDNLDRITQKQIELGIQPTQHSTKECFIVCRYGRSLLHEAIAMRDINLIREYIQDEEYIKSVDNNGDTPLDMAHRMKYTEVIKLFKLRQGDKNESCSGQKF